MKPPSQRERIVVVGMGYVGLPLALQFAHAGADVVGLDIDATKIESLNEGRSYIRHVPCDQIASLVESRKFRASSDFAACREATAILICVPTPLDEHQSPDLTFVIETGRSIAPHLSRGVVVVLESTTYPGTTEEDLRAVLEHGSGMRAGVDFHLAFSPEREDPGRMTATVKTIPKVIGGLTVACRNRASSIYEIAVDAVVPVSSCRVAEATKLLENIFRSVNIALVNELKVVYGAMGIDIWEVIEAAKTKPFGFMAFYPGPGLGGHCIPIDPFYLTWKAKEYGQHTRFIELAGQINRAMPDHVVGVVTAALNDASKSVRGSTVLLAGLAYKPNVDDDRESPAYAIMSRLEALGARVLYNDPFVPVIRPTREHPQFAGRASVPLDTAADAIVIVTAHDDYRSIDWARVECPVIDSRNLVGVKPDRYYRA